MGRVQRLTSWPPRSSLLILIIWSTQEPHWGTPIQCTIFVSPVGKGAWQTTWYISHILTEASTNNYGELVSNSIRQGPWSRIIHPLVVENRFSCKKGSGQSPFSAAISSTAHQLRLLLLWLWISPEEKVIMFSARIAIMSTDFTVQFSACRPWGLATAR